MPVEITTTLLARLVTILQAGASTAPLMRAGNWVNKSDPKAALRERTRTVATAFPWIKIEVGVSGSHSGYARDETFAVERTNFTSGMTDGFEIERTEEVRITLTDNKENVDGINVLKEAVIDDLMRAGTRLGIPDTVYRVGVVGRPVFTHTQRSTRENEIPNPGHVTEIRFFIVCVEDGRATLV